tara:strand:- start:10804 stop:11211 length:408 start_codon:yes stop_codon:yes gene_type:complete
MAEWTTIVEFTVSLPDTPGQLASFAARLRKGDIQLKMLEVRSLDMPHSRLTCIPENAEELRMFLRSTDLEFVEREAALLIEDAGQGSFTRTLEEIAAAGINLQTLRGVRLDDGVGYIVRPHESDRDEFNRFIGKA